MLQAGILGPSQKPLAAWAKQLGLSDDLRILHAILEGARADEKLTALTEQVVNRGAAAATVPQPHGFETQAERMRPDHPRALLDSTAPSAGLWNRRTREAFTRRPNDGGRQCATRDIRKRRI